MAKHSKDVIDVVVAKAKDGDLNACKMILDRISPPLKPINQPPNPIPIPDKADTSEISEIIFKEASQEGISIESASQLMGLLTDSTKLSQLEHFIKRLQYFENSRKK